MGSLSLVIHSDFSLVGDAMTSRLFIFERQGTMTDFLPELLVELNVALAMTQKELLLYVIQVEYRAARQ